jgi:NTE family protein
VEEKPWGPNYLRLGGRAVSDFQTEARFSLILQHTRAWVNSWGAEWRNELTLGDLRRFATSFYQPLGPGSPWFAEALLETVKSDADIFDNAFRRTDRLTNSSSGGSVTLGRRLGDYGVARVGLGHAHFESTPLISSRLEGSVRDNAKFATATVNFDTLDDANFPRHGYLLGAGVSSYRYGDAESDRVQAYEVQGMVPWTFGRFTLLGLASMAHSRNDRGGFSLGGLFDLSGTPVGAVTGSQRAAVAALAYYRMGELPRAVGRNWYAGFSLEAGNAWQRRSDMAFGDTRKAGSVFLGIDSTIGPAYFAWGKTIGGESAFYLFYGRPANRLQGN